MNAMQAFDAVFDDIGNAIKLSLVRTGFNIVSKQGKYSGQLRASTNLSINAVDTSKITVSNYTKNAIGGELSLAKRKFVVVSDKFKLGDKVFFTNHQDYAYYNEYKHSTLAFSKAALSFSNEFYKAVG